MRKNERGGRSSGRPGQRPCRLSSLPVGVAKVRTSRHTAHARRTEQEQFALPHARGLQRKQKEGSLQREESGAPKFTIVFLAQCKRKKENREPKGGMGGRHAATTQGF